jgi:hypothetical protein
METNNKSLSDPAGIDVIIDTSVLVVVVIVVLVVGGTTYDEIRGKGGSIITCAVR